MAITIIIDKSTFQSFSFGELYRLTCYYKHVITPVLTMEILGDLKKDTSKGSTLPEVRVKDFARKLFPSNSVVNLHYKQLIKGNLEGISIVMARKPIVGVNKFVASSTGQKGYIVQETDEEKSIHKWKIGNFSDADKELSSLWRVSTTNEDLLTRLKETLKTPSSVPLKDFAELNQLVDEHILNTANQQALLLALLQNYDIDAGTSVNILGRWIQEGKPLIKDFAPYAFHCLKVDTLFHFGLASGLIGTRPTNRVDLEYLYYIPFGLVFTSNDKVHKNLAPLLLEPDQKFITGPDLKQDLKIIVDHLDKLEIDERRKFKGKPPIIESSYTFQMWKEYLSYTGDNIWDRESSEEELQEAMEKIDEFQRARDGEAIDSVSKEDTDFVVIESFMDKNDPCFCGSGKTIIECCIPEKKFDEMVFMEQMEKFNKSKK
jgi:hypothetical protein